jgi:hypothetical protein
MFRFVSVSAAALLACSTALAQPPNLGLNVMTIHTLACKDLGTIFDLVQTAQSGAVALDIRLMGITTIKPEESGASCTEFTYDGKVKVNEWRELPVVHTPTKAIKAYAVHIDIGIYSGWVIRIDTINEYPKAGTY